MRTQSHSSALTISTTMQQCLLAGAPHRKTCGVPRTMLSLLFRTKQRTEVLRFSTFDVFEDLDTTGR